jgi:catechol 2,3-dioxygenase-like lactoylglutathione lyase family enzyme
MINRITHVCVFTPDLDATEKFYCGVLGLKKKFKFTKDGRIIGFYVEAGGGSYIEFFKQEDDIENSPQAIAHFCLEVSSIDEIIKKLDKEDIERTEKKMGCDNCLQVWATDPNGIKIEFQQFTKNSSQITGKDCIADW